MKFILIFGILCVWGFRFVSAEEDPEIPSLTKTIMTLGLEGLKDLVEKAPILRDFFFGQCTEVPDICPNENITFWYYSRKNPNNSIQILDSDEGFARLPRSKYPWKVIIHGYTSSKNDSPNPELRQAYFARGEYNILSVDYSPLAPRKCYREAVHNAPVIAKCTARFLDRLMDKGYLTLDNLHIIGFSLGAQVAGQIYDYLKHGKPKRITGLDPAGPFFDNFFHKKLNKDSAEFVDVIHTNGLRAGQLFPAGHVDFYLNGGTRQPGCFRIRVLKAISCNHGRSPLYFAESINSPDGFWGVPCVSEEAKGDTDEPHQILMGEDVPANARGNYCLNTNTDPPFALGKV